MIVVLGCSSLLLKAQAQAQHTPELAIRNLTVIDVATGRSVPGQDVIISEGRIAAIRKSNGRKVRAGQNIDGSGKFLIPGLWDMHTHNWWQLHFSDQYVANGVLGVRNMYTPMSFIRPLKDSIDNNLLHGPKYVAAGRVIEGPNPGYPDWLVVDSREKIGPALDTLQMEGSDFVKVYNKIPRDVYFELVREARRRGLSVQGHLPMAVTAIEASEAGQKSFEHLLGLPDLCTHKPLFANKHNYNWNAAVMREDDYGTLEIDEALAMKGFATLRKNQTYVCPTLVVWYNYMHPDIPFENNEPLKWYPEDMTGYWKNAVASLRSRDSASKAMSLKKYANLQKATFLLYKAGVRLLAGTDAINPYCHPGYSLHRELELLADCGIPAAEVLKMATIHAAEFLGLHDYGQVRPGYVASLVLLNQNPLTQISHTRSIAAVILKGKWLEYESLKKYRQTLNTER